MAFLFKSGMGICFGLFFFLIGSFLYPRAAAWLKQKSQKLFKDTRIETHKERGVNNSSIKGRDIPEKSIKKFSEFSEVFSGFTYKKYYYLKICTGLILFILTGYIFGLIFGMAGFIFGRLLPDMAASQIRRKNLLRFELQLIDGLTLIANALRSGASFNQAVDVMIKETKPPLSVHFARFINETRMGASVETALENIQNRVKSDEFKMVVVSINISRQAGGNLSEILIHAANTLRERERIRGKVDALTAQGRLSGYVIGSLPVLLLAVLYKIDPLMVQPLFSTLMGNVVLIISGLMILAGSLWIKKIVNIKY